MQISRKRLIEHIEVTVKQLYAREKQVSVKRPRRSTIEVHVDTDAGPRCFCLRVKEAWG